MLFRSVPNHLYLLCARSFLMCKLIWVPLSVLQIFGYHNGNFIIRTMCLVRNFSFPIKGRCRMFSFCLPAVVITIASSKAGAVRKGDREHGPPKKKENNLGGLKHYFPTSFIIPPKIEGFKPSESVPRVSTLDSWGSRILLAKMIQYRVPSTVVIKHLPTLSLQFIESRTPRKF